jgi:hypothetical protein
MATSGLCPPISSCAGLPCAVADSRTARPTAADPVKETARTSGRSTSAAPGAGPRPITTFSTPAGRPASVRLAASLAQRLAGLQGYDLSDPVGPHVCGSGGAVEDRRALGAA